MNEHKLIIICTILDGSQGSISCHCYSIASSDLFVPALAAIASFKADCIGVEIKLALNWLHKARLHFNSFHVYTVGWQYHCIWNVLFVQFVSFISACQLNTMQNNRLAVRIASSVSELIGILSYISRKCNFMSAIARYRNDLDRLLEKLA